MPEGREGWDGRYICHLHTSLAEVSSFLLQHWSSPRNVGRPWQPGMFSAKCRNLQTKSFLLSSTRTRFTSDFGGCGLVVTFFFENNKEKRTRKQTCCYTHVYVISSCCPVISDTENLCRLVGLSFSLPVNRSFFSIAVSIGFMFFPPGSWSLSGTAKLLAVVSELAEISRFLEENESNRRVQK